MPAVIRLLGGTGHDREQPVRRRSCTAAEDHNVDCQLRRELLAGLSSGDHPPGMISIEPRHHHCQQCGAGLPTDPGKEVTVVELTADCADHSIVVDTQGAKARTEQLVEVRCRDGEEQSGFQQLPDLLRGRLDRVATLPPPNPRAQGRVPDQQDAPAQAGGRLDGSEAVHGDVSDAEHSVGPVVAWCTVLDQQQPPERTRTKQQRSDQTARRTVARSPRRGPFRAGRLPCDRVDLQCVRTQINRDRHETVAPDQDRQLRNGHRGEHDLRSRRPADRTE